MGNFDRAVESEYFEQFLDDVGDGSGQTNMNQDHSVTPGIYFCKPQAGRVILIKRVLITVGDSGNFTASGYGAGATLSSGINFGLFRGGSLRTDLLPEPIISNFQWNQYCHDANPVTYGSGDNYLSVRWTFSRGKDEGMYLTTNDELRMIINDDLTGLTIHKVIAQGEQKLI